MSTGALVFMGLTWAIVLALAGFCFGKVLFGQPKRTRKTTQDDKPSRRKKP